MTDAEAMVEIHARLYGDHQRKLIVGEGTLADRCATAALLVRDARWMHDKLSAIFPEWVKVKS